MEMIVTISILVLISSLILANYPKFIKNVNISIVGQDVAFALRQAESFAMGVRAFDDPVQGLVYPPYGVHFSEDTPNEFIIFADVNKNSRYDGANENVERLILNKARIVDLCVLPDSSPPGSCGRDDIDVVYIRPDPSVNIKSQGQNFSDGSVVVDFSGEKRSIVFWISGQIYVKKI